MWLVLAPRSDDAALWAALRLRARCPGAVEVLSPELLVRASRWRHRLGVDGVRTAFTLADGRTFVAGPDDHALSRGDGVYVIRGVLNRLTFIDPGLFAHAGGGDRLYAVQECAALTMSWIAGLDAPVLNRPGPGGLAGAWRTPAAWAAIALQAGMAADPVRVCTAWSEPAQASPIEPGAGGGGGTMFVVAGRTLWRGAGEPDRALRAACTALAAAAGLDLCAVLLRRDRAGELRFVGATPLPDLRAGGEALIDLIADALRARPARHDAGAPSSRAQVLSA